MKHSATLGLLLAALLLMVAPTPVQAQSQAINTGTLQTVLYNNSNIGGQDGADGLTFNGVNGLFGMSFLLAFSPSSVIGWNEYNSTTSNGWTPGTIGPSTTFPYPALDEGVETTFSAGGVDVTLNAYWTTGTDFIVLDFVLTNTSGGTLTDLVPGMFVDYDVDFVTFTTNEAEFDDALDVMHVFDAATPNHFGFAMLSTEMEGWECMFPYLTSTPPPTDADALATMTTPGPSSCAPADIRGPIGATPITLGPGESEKVTFAIVVGTDEADFLANLAAVQLAVPVELTSFEAVRDGADVRLTWETASETNNAGFEVQMDRGQGYEALGFVEGHGTTTEAQTYAFTMRDLTPGHYQFRLKQLDFDGRFEYFGGVEVTVETADRYVLYPAYPNPFNPESTVRFAIGESVAVTVTLHDALGRQVATLYNGTPAADETLSVRIDGAGLPSGLYLVRLTGPAFSASMPVTLLK